MEYCDRCKKKIAMMYISGKTKLCLDCYNQWMAEVYGLDADSFQYPKNIAVTDRQGDLHFFNLHHIFFGSMVHWDADEENGDYHVEMDAPSEEPADRQLHNFHKKIAEKLWKRLQEPVIQNQEVGLPVIRRNLLELVFDPGNRKFIKKFRQTDVANLHKLTAGGDAKRTCNVGFSASGSTVNDQVVAVSLFVLLGRAKKDCWMIFFMKRYLFLWDQNRRIEIS